MKFKSLQHVFFGAVIWVGLGAMGCGGTARQPPADATQIDRSALESKLTGTWRLVDYRADVPLERNLQALLTDQLRSMTVRFGPTGLSARSTSFSFEQPFELLDVAGSLFKLRTKRGGVTYVSSCRMSEDAMQIDFHGETEPWLGTGVLRRIQ